MLKKLLASVLAVATVASCALVPSALTSAATTYETADAIDYAIWQLNNPAASEETVKVVVYVGTNSQEQAIRETAYYTIKVADNNKETIEAKLKADETIISGNTKKALLGKAATDMVNYTVEVMETPYANAYVANIVEKAAVVYSEYNENAAAPSDTKADTLKKADLKLLGYYETVEGEIPTNTVFADMYAAGAVARLASKAFGHWQLKNGHVVVPAWDKSVNTTTNYYTKVDLVINKQPWTTVVPTGAELVSGSYALKDNAYAAHQNDLYLPNYDQANWLTYLENSCKLQNGGIAYFDTVDNSTPAPAKYEYAGVRLVKAADTSNDARYAVIYTPVAGNNDKVVKYTVTFYDDNGTSYDKVAEMTGNYKYAGARYYTTDVAEIYTMLKGTAGATMTHTAAGLESKFNKDTLAAYLAQAQTSSAAAGTTAYVVTDTMIQVNVRENVYNANFQYVEIQAVVDALRKYDVYSFAEGDKVVKSSAWLTDAQIAKTNYKNIDAATALTKDKVVIKATQADLGVAANATVKGVPAEYAYAQQDGVNPVITTTYKLGDATANAADFATTTGEFDAEAYFGRAAKVGDVVTLKVSLSELGEAKKLDWKKITVEYSVVGGTAGESYEFSGSELYKDGIATDITLAAGTNIVTAAVSYDGKVIGAVAPFYAYVAE